MKVRASYTITERQPTPREEVDRFRVRALLSYGARSKRELQEDIERILRPGAHHVRRCRSIYRGARCERRSQHSGDHTAFVADEGGRVPWGWREGERLEV